MKKYLNGEWTLVIKETGEKYSASVPGSMYNDLLNAGAIKDPFWRDNESEVFELSRNNCVFEREFDLAEFTDSNALSSDKVTLVFEGIDTIANVYLNDTLIGSPHNMHCTYRYNVKGLLKYEKNVIRVEISSPLDYCDEALSKSKIWGSWDAYPGISHIRKAYCMFGWDWGPHLPDMGIWRDVYIETYDVAELVDIYTVQDFSEKNKVKVKSTVKYDVLADSADDLSVNLHVTDPKGGTKTFSHKLDGELYLGLRANGSIRTDSFEISIDNPMLWWPNGYGEQYLYNFKYEITCGAGQVLDCKEMKIGLREIKINRDKVKFENEKPVSETRVDYEKTEMFEFVVNGVGIFGMGADFIPEDNLLGRVTPERTKKLLDWCAECNFNMIRIWGGGLYPNDYFYQLCDELGLLVWQDFMVACALIDFTPEMEANFEDEIIDNVIRLRNHPSLALWCGNNEMEIALYEWGLPHTPKNKADYIIQYEHAIPKLLRELDPETFYWPASPSSGGAFDDPNAYNRGDCHYWGVWHSSEPIENFRNWYFMFASEYGMQSYPNIKTVNSFTLPEDRNVYSYVMEKHQRSYKGNEKISSYISQYLKYPTSFEGVIYASQIIQADGIKLAVEHWRSHRERCKGSVYWQLNDCWPVASWSSIDSKYRWKALQYYTKKFYAPVLVAIDEKEGFAKINVSSELQESLDAKFIWNLRKNDGTVVKSASKDIEIKPLHSECVEELDFNDFLTDNATKFAHYLECMVVSKKDGKVLSRNIATFVRAKYFELLDADISLEVVEKEDRYLISVCSDVFAKNVELALDGFDAVFSDNYFDIVGNNEEYVVELLKSNIFDEETCEVAENTDNLADKFSCMHMKAYGL